MNGTARWVRSPSEALWDASLAGFDHASVLQSYGWGEHRRRHGWSPERWIAHDRDVPVGLAQILVRRRAGITVAWAPGGPLIRAATNTEALLRSLVGSIGSSGPLYLRVQSMAPREATTTFAFERVFARPRTRLGPGFSIWHELGPGATDPSGTLSHHHRYYIKQAFRAGLRCEPRRDDEAFRELAALHREMREEKHLRALREVSDAELRSLRATLGDAFIYAASDATGMLSGWLVAVVGRNAYPLVAATGVKGRAIGASYAVIHGLLEHLRGRGVHRFDFGAADPRDARRGVTFFKLGFGGRLIEYIGEWEWASRRWLPPLMDLILRGRSDI